MANDITPAIIFSKKLDELMVNEATSGWMTSNIDTSEYSGGKEIKFPQFSTDGLGDYAKCDGYAKGSLKLEWQTETMEMDRSIEFCIDRRDYDESAFLDNAMTAMATFTRTQVIPEIDAYRYSKIAQLAIKEGKSRELALADDKILKELTTDIAELQDKYSGNVNLIITLSPKIVNILSNSPEIQKQFGVTDFRNGNIDIKAKILNGHIFREVSSSLLKTKYVFNDGISKFGFEAAPTAKNINWLITARTAPLAAVKIEEAKIFNPQENQKSSGWLLQSRLHHDLWILKNQMTGVFANISK